jgi:hypothetical protein
MYSPRLSRRDARRYNFEFQDALHRPILEVLQTYRLATAGMIAMALKRPRSTVAKALQVLYKQRHVDGVFWGRRIVYYLPEQPPKGRPGVSHELLIVGTQMVVNWCGLPVEQWA